MPNYAYRCPTGDPDFEKLTTVEYKDDIKCPVCDTPATRLISTFSHVWGMMSPMTRPPGKDGFTTKFIPYGTLPRGMGDKLVKEYERTAEV